MCGAKISGCDMMSDRRDSSSTGSVNLDPLLGLMESSIYLEIWSFPQTLDQFGQLRWNLEDRTTSTNFLDLNINIIQDQIQTKTFQKELNLYLYIPPTSAHPSSCFKGLITGELIRYWTQNTQEKDFIHNTKLFIQRLTQRGHPIEDIIPILRSAAANIDNTQGDRRLLEQKVYPDDIIYLHWRFHPLDIKKSVIHDIYNNTLKGHDNFQKMQIAMARPPNLRNILCRSNIPNLPGRNTSDILASIKCRYKIKFDCTSTSVNS